MVKQIQNQFQPNYAIPPGTTLLETLEALGMSQAELAERTGRPKKTINEIIKGKASLTPETALQLERALGIPASFWNNLEQQYRETLARLDEQNLLEQQLHWLKEMPVCDMVKLHWIEASDDKVLLLKRLLTFFGVASPSRWQERQAAISVAYRRSPSAKADPGVLAAWLRQGELEAQQVACAPYCADKFKEALQTLRTLTVEPPEVFCPQMQQLGADCGVVVVFVHELPRLGTSGATRWLTPSKALMQLSLRYKTDDQLWFTFFHEAGHILLHGKREIFLESDGDGDDKEQAADKFAADFLIPPGYYKRLPRSTGHYSEAEMCLAAQELGIAPGIIVGRLQHDRLLPVTHLNKLKRRLIWADN